MEGLEIEILRTPFDHNYLPTEDTRLTTNFANIAKDPAGRPERLARMLDLMGRRAGKLLGDACRYSIAIDIIRVNIRFADISTCWFPMAEMLSTRLHDLINGRTMPGPIGCNYSSFVRDYDFNTLLPRISRAEASPKERCTFGDLHGLLFKLPFRHHHSGGVIDGPALVAISVGNGRTYRRSGQQHPILGMRYESEGDESLTSRYFARMGLTPSYWMASGSQAPLAIYHEPGDLEHRDPHEMAALISVMDTFEGIYRPEIYRSRVPAGALFRADLDNTDYFPPLWKYCRTERDKVLGKKQAEIVWREFLSPNAAALERLMVNYRHLLPAGAVFPNPDLAS